MSDAVTPMAVSEPSEQRTLPFIFHGKAGEYFSIWIVNIALSIVTLGIYSAWAKVRTKRYFYGNMELDGHRFDYTAEPLQILMGRIIAIVVLSIVSFASNLNSVLSLVAFFIYVLLIPVVIVMSTRFNAAKSRYRNIPFAFTGTILQSYLVFLILPFVALLTFYLAMPWVHKKSQEFIYNNYRYGDRKFAASFSTADFYKIYGIGVLLFIVPGLVLVGIEFAPVIEQIAKNEDGTNVSVPISNPALLIGGYLLMLLGGNYIGVKILNLSVSKTTLDRVHGFRSDMGVWTYLWISVSNFALILVTLGLLYPYAQVRMTRYRSEKTTALAAGDLESFTADVEQSSSATSEGMADFLDVDLGF